MGDVRVGGLCDGCDCIRWVLGISARVQLMIDDGGHQNCQIMTTFLKLWPLLRPGGLYFLEGM